MQATKINRNKAERPALDLTGLRANPFYVLGAAREAARAGQWTKEEWEAVEKEALSVGGGVNIMKVLSKHFSIKGTNALAEPTTVAN